MICICLWSVYGLFVLQIFSPTFSFSFLSFLSFPSFPSSLSCVFPPFLPPLSPPPSIPQYKYDYSVNATDDGYVFPALAGSKVIAIRRNKSFVEAVNSGEECGLLLDKTCFYAEQGGQIYDEGYMIKDGADDTEFQVREGVGFPTSFLPLRCHTAPASRNDESLSTILAMIKRSLHL